MSKYCVIGRHGLIGSALAKRLGEVDSFPTEETKVIFDFGSYTHTKFEQNAGYHIQAGLDSFRRLVSYCEKRDILYVYPSSALVYEKDTEFSRFKKTLEQLASCYRTLTLGLRIFPVYGPGENVTVISKWCRDMQAGSRPVVFGDGTQTRDFIYIDDVVDQIISLVNMPCWRSRIVDIGTGIRTDFNSIVRMINGALGAELKPEYVNAPWDYSEGIFCKDPLPVKVTVEEGIRRIVGIPAIPERIMTKSEYMATATGDLAGLERSWEAYQRYHSSPSHLTHTHGHRCYEQFAATRKCICTLEETLA